MTSPNFHTVDIALAERSYPIQVGTGLLGTADVYVSLPKASHAVVVSNTTLLDKQTMLAVNRDFVSAGLNWLLNRERLIGITSKPKRSYRIQLTNRQHELIFWVTSVTLPGIILGLGFMVWATRRAA